ncbi:penicillin-binding protein [Herbaspirillum rubrisubalbicans]|jgi:penicillin-binding protein 2|uniref:Peptidoglycan D,D-transpeptidase MrdA n=2 Tax=Herbaspirillum rubrisubalbicans TaxID=80842 RepID=A0ABX9BVV7_9BURK|nr:MULTISPECIES: penicillin-binding protein 2 [Herbaspirillum]MCP1575184.1 penicillin-binding protein 2 [Herbaspirillum rubrisubalbicans]NQE49849.1 penicillin-binding protein [Herbaspirillum rubrisubalbicans]QJQ03678.1 penicillin-binding protein 2 [Herbaspirillum rubrisubalbicans Os34]RAM61980.1 penicillin-binding protein [Herbaspirillum rubrisubalbicans]RAN43293.1 penicillin-binding protein [Herbaspirillum rubrisubalbicans]
MTEFKNTAHELRLFRMRLLAASVVVLVCFSLLLARFLWLQVVRHDAYAAQAEENRISVVPIVPNRGLIMDRNGVVLARNYSAYTLEITPSKIKTNIDDLIDELSTIVEIQPRDRRRFRRLQEESKNFESVPIRTRLTDEEVAKFTAQRYRFPGVEVQARLFRQYPYGKTAAHVIGYIGRISQRDAERIADSDDEANYNGTDYIGKEGLEKSYETQLHGTTGYEEVEISASGRAVRSLSRTPATPGKNLILSIDIELQKVVEEAFGDQKGALVAINPATGDILAYVSQPSYDPNLFVEGIDQQSWDELNKSPDRPLLNRPLSGLYSPGSTYKPFMALAALELGKRRPQDAIRDPGFFVLGNHRFRDDKEGGHGIVDMYRSIVVSCDTYYYMLANDMGVNAIHDFMKPFGFGQITGIDLEHEKRGILPSTDWKRNAFRKPEQKRWIAGDTVSLGIGQGYNSFTPLQLAQATAILANNGVVMKPHLVKIIEDGVTHERTETVPKESYRIPLKQENIDFIKRAMVGVVKEGTGAAAFRGAPYESGGKTGTAQVVNIAKNQKYDSRKLSRIFHDNGLYIGFAPADAPRIAIAAVVENGGWGAGVAAPLVRKAMDYFMLGKRPNEPIKSVAPDAASPDTPVEGPTSEEGGSSNTPTVQPDVQE